MKIKIFLIALIAVAGILASGCHKEPKPSFLGKWRTVTTVGFKFDYEITPLSHCRKLPEYFGETSFCYPYQKIDDNTIVVNSQYPERWVFSFLGECDESADVFVTLPDSSKQEFILIRIE